mgnify:CR=1 FL=1
MTDKPTRLQGAVQKGWGYELIFATNEKYCGKILFFEKAGNKFSMHFHHTKEETWYVLDGQFFVKWIDTKIMLTKPILVFLNSSFPSKKTIANQNNCGNKSWLYNISTTILLKVASNASLGLVGSRPK